MVFISNCAPDIYHRYSTKPSLNPLIYLSILQAFWASIHSLFIRQNSGGCTFPETNMAPQSIGRPKRKCIFQPLSFKRKTPQESDMTSRKVTGFPDRKVQDRLFYRTRTRTRYIIWHAMHWWRSSRATGTNVLNSRRPPVRWFGCGEVDLPCDTTSHSIHGTGIFPYIYPQNYPIVGKCAIHGRYGCWWKKSG